MSERPPSAETRRWALSDEELQRIESSTDRRAQARAFARAHLRSPALVAQTTRSALRGAVQGIRSDQSLPWILHDEHARAVIPDAGSHATAHGLELFEAALEPVLDPSSEALELGCGGGRVARVVAPKVSRLTCADLSKVMLDEARTALAGQPNVRYLRTQGLVLEALADAAFDLVYAHDVFITFDANPLLAMLDEVRRVLRPGGATVASFYTIDRPEWARAQLDLVRRGRRWGEFGASYPRPYTAPYLDSLYTAAGLAVTDRSYGSHAEGSDDRAHYVVTARRDS